eukprot:7006864-Pyramimonas_sp.AAC.1
MGILFVDRDRERAPARRQKGRATSRSGMSQRNCRRPDAGKRNGGDTQSIKSKSDSHRAVLRWTTPGAPERA